MGKSPFSMGKSPFSMGKSTISMAITIWLFNSSQRAGLSMLYSIVGVGLNAMPMAAFQDALTNLFLGT